MMMGLVPNTGVSMMKEVEEELNTNNLSIEITA
jgi:hypothetical protein